MTNLHRYRVSWSGFIGAPGVSTFYVLDAAAFTPKIATFLNTLASVFPADVTQTFPIAGDIIDPLNGDLVGEWVGPAQAANHGTSGGAYAAPVGAIVNWHTGTILSGHRLNGRTFLVPAAGAIFESDGTLADAIQASIKGAADALIAATPGNLVVWNRPRPASVKHPVERAGGFSVVVTSSVPDEAAILRSRRD